MMNSIWPQLQSYKTQLFLLLLICFASAILGDSTAEALLLANYDSSIIPRMFLFNALGLFVISSVMMIVIDNVDRGVFFLAGLLIHGTLLILFKVVITLKLSFIYPILFTYAYITKILLFMIFWTLANDLIDSRKAGKEFPIIAAGGTLGAVMVSFSIPSILKIVNAQSLLLVWIVLVAAAILLFLPINRQYGAHFKARSERVRRNVFGIVKDLDLLRQEPLLFNMGILYFLLFFLMLNQHFLFYSQLKKQFVTASGVASFLGYFNGISMVSTFVLQTTVSGRVLKRFGSARSMLLVPLLFTLFFLCLFVVSAVNSNASLLLSTIVIAGMGLRIAFFDSFFSPNFQIFFSSLPQHIRGRGKLTMEGVVKPCAMVLTGTWLIWAGRQLPVPVQSGLLFVIGLLAIWQTLRIKNRYAESLTNYLTGFYGKKASGVQMPDFNNSPEVIRTLGERLYKEDSEVKKFIIELIASSSLPEATRILVEYYDQSDSRTRSILLASIHGTSQRGLKNLVEKSLFDSDARVVSNAVLAIVEISPEVLMLNIDTLLKHASSRVRANTVFSAWRFSDETRRKQLMGYIYVILYEKFPEESPSALFALGEMQGDAPTQLLFDFVKFFKSSLAENPSVFIQSVRALGKKKFVESADLLLQLSSKSTRKQRNEIMKALGGILSELTYEQLCSLAFATDYYMLNLIVNANHQSGKVIDDAWRKHLRNCAEREMQETIAHMDKLRTLSPLKGNGVELLRYAVLEEHIDVRINTLINIASLLDISGNIRKIIPRLFHSNAHMRARALEVLDNTGDYKLNRNVMNILDNRMSLNIRLEETGFAGENSCFDHLAKQYNDDPNEWVAQCARYVLETERMVKRKR
jgi:ATP/ADP translocase